MSEHTSRSNAFRNAAAQLRRQHLGCWLCGNPIDYTAPRNHPAAFEVDHVIPKSKGGTDDPTNLRPSHSRCNRRRGAGRRNPPPQVNTWHSRDWTK
jgi:5-methylcytosine-specific restriction endonuclease McrA